MTNSYEINMSERLLLLNSQKKMVFDEITSKGIQPSDFEWLEVPSIVRPGGTFVSQFRHKQSGYFFQFDHSNNTAYGSHYYKRSPGNMVAEEQGFPGDWDLMWKAFVEWTEYVIREVQIPDYWADVANHGEMEELFSVISNNDPIGEEEQLKIAEAFRQIRSYLGEKEVLDDKKWKSIDEKLDLILESTKKIGKKEWTLLMFGGFVSIFTSGMFAPEQATIYFHHALEIIKTVLTQMRLLK